MSTEIATDHVIRGVRFKRDEDGTIVVTSTDPDVQVSVEFCEFVGMNPPPGQRAVFLFPDAPHIGVPA